MKNTKLWRKKTVEVPRTGRRQGAHDKRRVYQRDSLIDINQKDKLGRTNKERMDQGLAPIGPDGNSLQLHHTTQVELHKQTGKRDSVIEIEETLHKEKSSVLHNPDQKSFRTERAKDTGEYRSTKKAEGKTPIKDKDKYQYTDKKGKARSELDKKSRTQDDKDFEAFKKDYWKLRAKDFE